MFDLNTELRLVLARLGDKKLVNRACLDEVESHLRDEVDDLMASGDSAQEALSKAVRAFGAPEDLLREYATLYGGNRAAQLRNVISHYFDERVVMKAFIGVILGLGLMMLGMILEGGHLSAVLSTTSFLFVTSAAIGTSLLHSPPALIATTYAAALRGGAPGDTVFRAVGRNFLSAGLAGALIGIIQVLSFMHSPDLIGPALAFSLVSLLYGYLGYLIFGLGFEASDARDDDAEPLRLIRVLPSTILIIGTLIGILRYGLGREYLLNLVHVSSAFIVLAGIMVVGAFVRRIRRTHLPHLANGALVAGIVGFLIGIIHIMENLDKPEMLFVGLSVTSVPLLYGVLIAGALRSVSDAKGPRQPQPLLPYFAATVGVLIASITLVIYAVNLVPKVS